MAVLYGIVLSISIYLKLKVEPVFVNKHLLDTSPEMFMGLSDVLSFNIIHPPTDYPTGVDQTVANAQTAS